MRRVYYDRAKWVVIFGVMVHTYLHVVIQQLPPRYIRHHRSTKPPLDETTSSCQIIKHEHDHTHHAPTIFAQFLFYVQALPPFGVKMAHPYHTPSRHLPWTAIAHNFSQYKNQNWPTVFGLCETHALALAAKTARVPSGGLTFTYNIVQP